MREERSQSNMLMSPHSGASKVVINTESDLSASLRASRQLSPNEDDEIGRKIKFLLSFDFFKVSTMTE
jgi:hypothetical protein